MSQNRPLISLPWRQLPRSLLQADKRAINNGDIQRSSSSIKGSIDILSYQLDLCDLGNLRWITNWLPSYKYKRQNAVRISPLRRRHLLQPLSRYSLSGWEGDFRYWRYSLLIFSTFSLRMQLTHLFAGNVGLGKETILQVAHHNPAHIYLSARNESKALESIKDIQSQIPDCPPISFIQCDLTSLPSVQKAAREFVSQEERLDILILNAGIMATPPGTTEQGYEIQFGTNHVGHALLTKLLIPTLLETAEKPGADVRVISLSSVGHAMAPVRKGIDFSLVKTDMSSSFTFIRYGQSKLANILFIKELAKQYPQITAVSIHPGVVNTELYRSTAKWLVLGSAIDLARRWAYTTVQDGAKNQLWASTARKGKEGKGEVQSGEYYTPIGVQGQGNRWSKDEELAEKLWIWTETELKQYTL